MKAIIVEDEYMVAKRLKRFVENAFAGQTLQLHLLNTLDDANDYLANNIIDVLFLDLNLQGQNGFDLLKQQVSKSFHTIVVSANTDRAIEAFDIGVLDFIAKPFTQERVQKAVNRLRDGNSGGKSKYLSYKYLGKIELLPIANVLYLKADGHYCEIHTQDEKVILHDKSLDKLLAVLPENFQRIHRTYAVPLESIQSIISQEGSKYWLTLTNQQQLPIGRTRLKSLRECLIQ
ncbi:LytR/AlgR family response regulator transcription factor [Aliikangiella sp. IMCC44359]|uniref:LytR/AlgR family response regulator transcription factor n=1 Tax=Aliikangiella sp. IMCC44359 TaxID=3459125 RepID=UPI00403B22DC